MAPEKLTPDSSPSTGQPPYVGTVRPIRSRLRALSPVQIALIALGLVLFLAISGLLARFLSTENVERDDVLAVLQAQTSGSESAMLSQLSSCRTRPACVERVEKNTAALRRPGSVKILSLTSTTAYSLTGSTGSSRVAWTVIGRLPVVQCVTVKRTGNFLSGVSIALLSVSAPIPNEADC